jgi:predicted Zn-dependent protease
MSRIALRKSFLGVLAACLSAGAWACAVNPATGETQLSLIGEGQEIAMGREADEQLAATELYPDSSLQRYIQGLGTRIAAVGERPNLPWSFRVMDDPVVNAFALPGGFIYITRGIMTHLTSEAQLVGIVGHEIGHVTAKHSVEQMSRAQIAQVGVVAGSIFVPQVFTQAASAGLGLLFLRFSRDDERQADDLGLRYLVRAGYDPRPMPEVFTMLDRVTAAAGGSGTPEWLSTHPNPANRAQRLQQEIAALQRDFTNATVNADAYLARIDGLVFGDDPRQGFFRDNVFHHPDLVFQFTFPTGWRTQNSRQAVAAISAEEDALIGLTVASGPSASAAAQQFFGQDGISGTPRSTQVNGLPAVRGGFTAATEGGQMQGEVVFVEYRGGVYRILGYADAAKWSARSSTVSQSLGSFRAETDRAVLDVKPMRVDIVTADRAMTLTEFNRRFPSAIDIEQLALINQVQVDASIPAGAKLKRVVHE